MVDEMELLIVSAVNIIVAGLNLTTAIINNRNRKELSSSASKKAPKTTRE